MTEPKKLDVKHPIPYRANLDSKHDETIQEKVARNEADKGWDQPPPKLKWKKK